jgi:hypothetical protein
MFRHKYILIHNCEALHFFLINKLIGFLLLIDFYNDTMIHNRVYNAAMNILEIAIKSAGGTGRLAFMLDVKQNVVCNWRQRGAPKSWEQVMKLKFKKQIAEAQKVVV